MRGIILDPVTGRPENEEPFGGVPLAELDDILDLARHGAKHWKPKLAKMMRAGDFMAHGGSYLQDSRPPFNQAAFPSVTMATTSKMTVPTNPYGVVGATEWFAGKKFMVRQFGVMTTQTTPGNLTIEVRAGTADAGGTLLATTAALTLIASQTTISWRMEFRCECWNSGSGGASGALLATGRFECNPAVIAAGDAMIPASGVASVTTDLSAQTGISPQMKRSGSTVETLQVFSHEFQGLT